MVYVGQDVGVIIVIGWIGLWCVIDVFVGQVVGFVGQYFVGVDVDDYVFQFDCLVVGVD